MSKRRRTNYPNPKSASLEAIKQQEITQLEKKAAAQDWGIVEENAYIRMKEGSINNIPGEQFLHWLSELEQGHQV